MVATFLGAVAVAVGVVACGIDLLGTGGSLDDGEADAGGDAPGSRDAGGERGDEGGEIFLDAQPFDALLDVNPANCYPVCDGGNCNEAGACVFKCNGNDRSCPPNGERIVCPPGVPCEVYCSANNSCDRGVDCSQASRCFVDCNGMGACRGGTVDCAGDSCEVRCRAPGTCDRSVSCDAGSCNLRCTGANACVSPNEPVQCFGSSCAVQCGADGVTGACDRGVVCTASDSCSINCASSNTCRGGVVAAVADKVSVTCNGAGTCDKGVRINAGDGGVTCKGNEACGTASSDGVTCDGGYCHVACDGTGNTAIRNCCNATLCAPPRANGCSFTANNCQ